MIEIRYLIEKEFEKYAGALFAILYDNMSLIVPTGNSREDDFTYWSKAVREGLKSDTRHIIIILIEDTKEVAGYFQYSVHNGILMMEEIEIKKSYQGKSGIFRKLYGFVLGHIGEDICFVEAYANKNNKKSLGILKKLGLSVVGENELGTRYHLRGTYGDLLNWYGSRSLDY